MRGPPVAHRICLWQGCQTRAGRRARPPPPPRPPPGPPTCHWNRLRGDEKQLGGCARMPPKQAGTHARRVSAAGPAGAATGQGPQQLPVRQGCERTRQHLRDPGDAQTSQDSGPSAWAAGHGARGEGPAPWPHSVGAAWRAALASITVDSSLMISLRILTSKGMFVQRSGSGKKSRTSPGHFCHCPPSSCRQRAI